jgi:carboxypeptidase T
MPNKFDRSRILYALILLLSFAMISATPVENAQSHQYYWLKIKATDKFQRSVIADDGIAIEIVKDDYVIAYGSDKEKQKMEARGLLIAASNLKFEKEFSGLDFPKEDEIYHNYAELTSELNKLASENPDILELSVIGKTVENRDIFAVRINTDHANAQNKPALIVMGGHHAREHLSVEMPLKFINYLVTNFRNNDERVKSLIETRDIHIIPAVNPDGLEYDISGSSYRMWRKNRSKASGSAFGVDLNRNYDFQWGTGGSSSSPSSDTYMGPRPFSEPETQAIKKYVEEHTNITVLLSFHSFSKLILYPWGHKYSGIEIGNDKVVHQKMAEKMSTWNGYTPQQSSELYIASGDTTDWSYGVHKIISFTFELDPSNSGFGGDGFYPGPTAIESSFNKNIEPLLYLLDYSDNPYRVLNVGIGPIGP